MKPVVHRHLKSRYSPELIALFEGITETARDAMKNNHMKASRVNKIRLSLLDTITRDPIDYDALIRQFTACEELWERVAIQMQHEEDFWCGLKEALSLPYVHIPPAEWAVISLCATNRIPIEPGDNDFSDICYLVLEELNDPRAPSKARRKAFRQKLIENRHQWLSRFFLSYKPGRAVFFESARRALPANTDPDTINKILDRLAGLK